MGRQSSRVYLEGARKRTRKSNAPCSHSKKRAKSIGTLWVYNRLSFIIGGKIREAKAAMRIGKFYLDFLDEQIFDGYTKDEQWNGFACPYFTFEQSMKLVDAWRAKGWQAEYNKTSDQFTFKLIGFAEGENQDSFSAKQIEGMMLYPIGAFSWIGMKRDSSQS
jgi:hypothetical protein